MYNLYINNLRVMSFDISSKLGLYYKDRISKPFAIEGIGNIVRILASLIRIAKISDYYVRLSFGDDLEDLITNPETNSEFYRILQLRLSKPLRESIYEKTAS